MKEKKNIRELFLETVQKDPQLVCFITAIADNGVKFLTRNGMVIVFYHNKKLGTTAILDPAKPTLFIQDSQRNIKLNISINLAAKLTLETFGMPELLEIPKIGTNLIPGLDFTEQEEPDPKNLPLFHQKQHPTDQPEN